MIDRAQAVAGGVAASVATVFDLVAFGGDFIIAGIVLVLSDLNLVVSTLSYATTFASRVAWLPEDIVEQAYLIALGALILLMIARLLNSWRNGE